MRFVAISLLLCASLSVGADEASWLGRQVMLRESGVEIEVVVGGQPAGTMPLNSWEVFTILREQDGSIWIRNREAEGWLKKDSAVLDRKRQPWRE